MSEAPNVSTELTTNRLRTLVHLWMSIWDRNSGDAAPLLDLLSPEGFEIKTGLGDSPPLTTIPEVQAWFAAFPKQVKVDNHIVEKFSYTTLSPGRFKVRVYVRCPGVSMAGQDYLVFSDHTWEVVDYGGMFPRISKLSAKLSGPAIEQMEEQAAAKGDG